MFCRFGAALLRPPNQGAACGQAYEHNDGHGDAMAVCGIFQC
jgi:hypothetical protein